MRRIWTIALWVALTTACEERKPELFGVIRGCTRLTPDRVCEYTSGSTVAVWFDASTSAKLEVELDGDDVPAKLVPALDGARLELPLPDRARRLQADVGAGRFTLPLAWVETATPAEPGPREAYRLHQAGLRALRAGKIDRAHELLLEAEAKAKAVGDAHRWREVAYPLTYVEVMMLGDLAAADMRLRDLPSPAIDDGRAMVGTGWARGLLAIRLADRRAAHSELADAARWGERIDDPAGRDATNQRALLLLEAGEARIAASLFDSQRTSRETNPCRQATNTANAGWARLSIGTTEETQKARALFEEALATYSKACPSPPSRNNQRINLALASLELDDVDGARSYSLKSHSPAPTTALPHHSSSTSLRWQTVLGSIRSPGAHIWAPVGHMPRQEIARKHSDISRPQRTSWTEKRGLFLFTSPASPGWVRRNRVPLN